MKLPKSIRRSAIAVIIALGLAMNAKVFAGDVLLSAHAHNDYEHPHPLLDALAQGFDSVEADIWLVDGQLLVAHNLADVKVERTLQALYLDPLRERIRQNGGHVFTNALSFTLMIDVKSAAEPTYVALRQMLLGYTNNLTSFTATKTETNSLNILLTGNRSQEMVAAEPLRYIAIDGRLADMKTNPTPQLVPLISENWTQHFKWRGKGGFPEDEQTKLRQLVEHVHQQGRRLRFWAIPDTLAGWRELQSAGVDVIGTDDLVGLAKFLQSNRP
jgi:glycerophosphoryl diester phosphodiesterase